MATIKYKQNGTTYSCWSSTGRVTTPSLCFKDGSTTKYVPLFAVGNGSEGSSGNYYFKVGGLCAKHNGTTYRAALSRRYASSVSSTISTTISHSGKTGSTTGTTSKTLTFKPSATISANIIGTQTVSKDVTVNFGVTFSGVPNINCIDCSLQSFTYSSCVVSLSKTLTGGSYGASYVSGTASGTVVVTGNVTTTVTTYPNETKSATASGNFNYGVTYPSAPSLTVNSGGVTATNNSGNASFKASKSLSGTVAYGKSATLSQAFKVSFTGAI